MNAEDLQERHKFIILTIVGLLYSVGVAYLFASLPNQRFTDDFFPRWHASKMFLTTGRSLYDWTNAREVSAITGWQTSLYEILTATERSLVMARVFNNREGFTPKDDRIIRRWHEKMPAGPLEGRCIEPEKLQEAIALYYDMSGWDQEGRPKRAKLVELNLGWLVD